MPVFHGFPNLPPELREQIWRDALPEESSDATLFAHEAGYWVLPDCPDDEDEFVGWYFSNTTAKITLDRVPAVRLTTPLLNANREARRVAVAWARRRGYGIARGRAGDGDGDGPAPLVMARRVDPTVDAIYYPNADVLSARGLEPWRMMHSSLAPSQATFDSPVIAVAVPWAMVEEDYMWFYSESKIMHNRWRILYVILGPQPDDLARGTWELQHHPDYGPGSLVWDVEACDFSNVRGVDGTAEDGVSVVIETVALKLAEMGDFVLDMELRLARAVRRG